VPLHAAPDRGDRGAPRCECGHAAGNQARLQELAPVHAFAESGKRIFDCVEKPVRFALRAKRPHELAPCLARRRAAFVMASTSSPFVMFILFSIPMLAESSTWCGFLLASRTALRGS